MLGVILIAKVRRVMAAAEAKPSQKHLENRFSAQDDGHGISKLLPTPSSSSNSECKTALDHRAHGFYSPTEHARVPASNPMVEPDSKIRWEKALQPEVDDLSIGAADKKTVSGEEHENIEELEYQVYEKDDATEIVYDNKSVNKTKKTDCMYEFQYIEDHFMDWHTFDSQKQGENVSFDLEPHWTGTEKTKPWWQSAGKDELASLVARKSLENLENCDLPQPRTKHHRKDQSACYEYLDQDCFLPSSLTEMQFSSSDGYSRGTNRSVCMGERQYIFGTVGHSLQHQDHFSSSGSNDENNSNRYPSKAQLLEALCHSQTRAREAEKAAQEADTEKQHVVSLFLSQASQLFAYKQWFQLLQLQNICLQLRNKDQPNSGVFSDVLPWVPCKDRQFNQQRNGRKKRGGPRCRITMYDVVVAVGVGLTGAGLLLGWISGWLVSIF